MIFAHYFSNHKNFFNFTQKKLKFPSKLGVPKLLIEI